MDTIQRVTKIPEGVLKHHVVLRQSPPAPMAFTNTSNSQSIFLLGIPPKTMITGVFAKLVSSFTVPNGGSVIQQQINFDDLSGGTTVTNQYANKGVVFSSADQGQVVQVSTQPSYMSSSPNIIGTATGGGAFNCLYSIVLDFSTPVYNLEFDAVGNQTPIGQPFAYADVYLNFSPTAFAHVPMFVSQGNYLPDHQNFSGYAGITKLVINPSMEPQLAGTAYDSFTYIQHADFLQTCTVTLSTTSQVDGTITSASYLMPSFECAQAAIPSSFMYWSPWAMYSTYPQDLRAVFTSTGAYMKDIISGEIEFTIMYQMI